MLFAESEEILGLNRTSVGLKPETDLELLYQPAQPQSNQRGIETTLSETTLGVVCTPQSNQRGIETEREVVSRRT